MTSRKITKDNEPKENNRPTFILKTREGENRAVSPSQRNGGKKEQQDNHQQGHASNKIPEPRPLTIFQEMTSSIKFMDENLQMCDNPLDYLYEQQDFLVVGVVGAQGVGKSTILSLLTSNYASVNNKIRKKNISFNGLFLINNHFKFTDPIFLQLMD